MTHFIAQGVAAGTGSLVHDHPNFVEYAKDTDETLPAPGIAAENIHLHTLTLTSSLHSYTWAT